MSVVVTKEFSFDSAHQLVGHEGKCANIHGHTYKLQVSVKNTPSLEQGATDEGFVIDFGDLKRIVNSVIVDPLDHAFIAQGNEPTLDAISLSRSKVQILGFRTTVENMAQYICWRLIAEGLPMHSVKMWETPTGSAEVFAKDLIQTGGPVYNQLGGCDLD